MGLKIFSSKGVFYNTIGISPTVPISRDGEILTKAVELAKAANPVAAKTTSSTRKFAGLWISEKPNSYNQIGAWYKKGDLGSF